MAIRVRLKVLLTRFTSGIYMCLYVEVVAKETSMTPLT